MAVQARFYTARSWVKERRNRKLGWATCVAEWIDNSIGNGATKIYVTWKPHFVEVRDNGVGCTETMFAALVSPGWHEEDEEVVNTVSMFGIGAKDAFLWSGGPTQCFSCRNEMYLHTSVDWDSFGNEPNYDPMCEGEAAERLCRSVGLDSNGVVVRQPQHTRQMTKSIFEDVHKSLSKMFWSAVETGVDINVRFFPPGKGKAVGGLLKGKPMPQFISDTIVDEEMKLADGRTIYIKGGILDPAVRLSSPGFEYIFGHRVVIPACGTGAGEADFERVYFRVFLSGDKEDWRVTTNKVGLHDADEAALGQAVYDRCKDVLSKAASQPIASLLDQELLDEVAALLTQAHKKQAKRSPKKESTGTKESTGSGSTHSSATNLHERDGKYDSKGSSRRSSDIKIHRVEFEDEKAGIVGEAKVKDKIVRLNVRHPFIEQVIGSRDVTALFVVAMSLWSDAWINCDDGGQRRLVERDNFIGKMSRMLITSTNESTTHSPASQGATP